MEEHFLRSDEEGRSTAILGRIHKSSTYDSIKWLSEEELKAYDEEDKSVQDIQWFQETGILVRIMPGEVFSIRLVFREELTNISVSDFKELFKTHMTAHMAPKGNGLQGLIESPNYAFNQYSNNADMKWLVRLPPNRDFGIQLQINELETESCCDRMTIFDGPTMKSPVIGLLSGSLDNNTVVNYTTSGPDTLIEFRSDCSVDAGYFSFTFNTIKFPLVPACNGQEFLEGTEGYIVSANYPVDYPEMADCDWIIKTPRSTTVTLEIIDFQLDDRDTVSVRERYSAGTNQELALLSGEVAAHTMIYGKTNELELLFMSENHVFKLRGFNFYYTATRVPQPCVEGVIIQDSVKGEIMSQNYPRAYESDSTCTWQIRMAEDYVILFNIDDFDTEAVFDFLNFYDGPDDSYTLLASLSGTAGQEGILLTSNNVAFLKFTSDYSVNGQGFHLTYNEYTKSSTCDGTQMVIGSSGFITTPNYPNPFPSFSNCSWSIQTDMNTIAVLVLVDLDLGLNTNSNMQIYDGPSASSRLLYSGSYVRQSLTLNATQNRAFISISTIDNFEFRGFLLRYEQLDVVSYCSSAQLLTGPQGDITSPLYPSYYPSGYSCSWWIQTPLFTTVGLLVKEFQLSPLDILIGYDGTDDKAPQLFTCTGSVCPVIPSTSHNMFLVLNTKSTNVGFSFRYYGSSDTCSGSSHISDSLTSGFITSPLFPSDYPSSTSCEWLINGTPREKVEINIQGLYTEACCDWLRIYDGNSRNDTMLLNWSGLHGKTTIITNGSQALIAFDVDFSVTARGFSLSYDTHRIKTPDTGSGEEMYYCSAYDNLQEGLLDGHGYISSPNYAYGYSNNLDYCWYIALDALFRATRLTFMRVETEESFDVIQVYRGESTNPDFMERELSGDIYNYAVVIQSYLSTVLFHTDNTVGGKGFVMEFQGLI